MPTTLAAATTNVPPPHAHPAHLPDVSHVEDEEVVQGPYPFLVVARGVAALRSSAPHPVGYSILASYFPHKRGSVIALNTSASNVGTLIATPLAGAMLLIMGWRQVFYVVAFISLIMGL